MLLCIILRTLVEWIVIEAQIRPIDGRKSGAGRSQRDAHEISDLVIQMQNRAVEFRSP